MTVTFTDSGVPAELTGVSVRGVVWAPPPPPPQPAKNAAATAVANNLRNELILIDAGAIKQESARRASIKAADRKKK
jgi:hypothetical protein